MIHKSMNVQNVVRDISKHTRVCNRRIWISEWPERWSEEVPRYQVLVWEAAPVYEYTGERILGFSSVAQSCPTLCNPMNCSTPGLPVHHQLLEFTPTYVHWVGDAIQPSHPLSSPSPPAHNPSQHQSLFQWVNSLHEVAKVLEFQL